MSTGMWNLNELYSGPEDPAIEADLLEAERHIDVFAKKWRDRTDHLVDPAMLRIALDELEMLNRKTGSGDNPGYYAVLAKAIDTANPDLKSLEAMIDKRSTAMTNAVEFFALSVGAIDPEIQAVMLASEELAPYRTWLSRRFEAAAHDLSVAEETILNEIMPQATGAWTSMVEEKLSNTMTMLGVEEVPFNQLGSCLSTSDIDLADRANAAHVAVVSEVAGIAEHELNAVITTKIKVNRLRGYARDDGPSFLRYGVTAATIDSMLDTVESRYDICHEYYNLMARLQGRCSLSYHHRALSYGTLPSGYTYDEASSLLRDVLGKLHQDFVDEFDVALADGHIDHLPRKGKRGGAACWSNLIDQPTYMMLSFTGELGNIETLGHEFGHYLNNRYMQKGGRCHALSFGTSTPLAETASTFFEQYVLDAVSDGVDEETKLAIQLASLQSSISTIFRQTAATRFEQDLYKEVNTKGHLSKEEIGTLFTQHMAAYLGPSVVHDEETAVGWVHWMHFRRGFYNYGYTFAQLLSSAFQDRVNADPAYINKFRRFLESGRSQTTTDLLQSLDFNVEDGSVWNAGLDKLEQLLHSTSELARKLGKI